MRCRFGAVVLLLVLFASLSGAVEKFPLPESPIQLEGEPSPGRYFDVVGRRALLMGNEGGAMEAWIYPFKIAHGLRIHFRRDDFPEPLPAEELARWITVRPESTTVVFSHDEFTVAVTFFVPLEEPAIVLLLDVDADEPLTVSVSFVPDLEPMWPASLGGQYSFWHDEAAAFVLSESRRRYNALVGSPAASRHFATPAHRLAESPNRFDIEITTRLAASDYIPVVIAGGSMGREEALETYRRVLGNLGSLYSGRVEHACGLRGELLAIDSPDDDLDLAFEWAKVALDDGLSCNPDLGCGLVAGFGSSGRSERPGFAWFFGGDAFFNSFALNGYGDFAAVRTALELIRRNQREDGKIMHELSQGAAFIDWFGDYPYGYYHLETSPYYIISVWNYVLASGDLEFLRQSWPSMLAAFRYAATTETDGDGLVENSLGGLGALEVGVLLQDLKTDIYVAGLWVESIRSLLRAAELLAEEGIVDEVTPLLERAEESLRNLFFDPQRGYHAFAIALDGTAVSELTAWPAVPMIFGLLPAEQALATLHRLAGPEMATDWGARMLTSESEVYDPVAYNNGAVWPFLTGYVAMAQYRYHRPQAGLQLLRALAGLTFEGSRGDIAELYSGDFHRPLDAAVPHQLFSSGGFAAPVVRGLLGLETDAVSRTLTFAPQLPAEWDRLTINNVPLGLGKNLRVEFERGRGTLRYRFRGAEEGWILRFRPALPLGTLVGGVYVNGNPVEFGTESRRSAVVLECEIPLRPDTNIEVSLEEMTELILPVPPSLPGQRSQGLRYVDSWRQGETIYYSVAGRTGRTYECIVLTLAGTTSVQVSIPADTEREFATVTLAIRDGRLSVADDD